MGQATSAFDVAASTATVTGFDSAPVQELLSSRCYECHGPDARDGGLRMLSREDFLQLNDSGLPAITLAEGEQSELLRRVQAGDDERMPPEGEPLTADEIELLRDWVAAGLPWDDDASETHWAYVPPERPLVPVTEHAWGNNEIDAFILRRIEQEAPDLGPSAPASPERLIRRVYLDLIGLPPTPEQVAAFVADPSPERYAAIVDELLASPRYGEKWARGWLDLARYADSNGFQADQFREIWPYRDWVISAMNDDMPFDRFTIEQIAGDLLPEADDSTRTATGFHRCTTCNVEAGVDPEENRVNQIIDRVNTTGTVWLGTTLECAQCHNHKYDPFTQQDYYQLFAFFNNTPLEVELPGGRGVQYEVAGPKMELPLPEDEAAVRRQLTEQRDTIQTAHDERTTALAAEFETWLAELTELSTHTPQWHTLHIVEFESTAGCTSQPQEDGSLLLSGDVPDKADYVITVETDVDAITGFKLETLTDESLPGMGPGRGSAERPNFVLYEFEAAVLNDAGEPTALPLTDAQADFSQQNWNVTGLIDGDPETGWGINPQFGQPHWAAFQTREPITNDGTLRLRFRLPQHYGGGRVIGRLRLSAMTGDPGVDQLSAEVLAVLQKPADERTEDEVTSLRDLQASKDAVLQDLDKQLTEVRQSLNALTPPTTLVMVEMDEARMSSIFHRGDFLQPGTAVAAMTPAALHPLATEEESPTRLDLAHWIVSRDNPLTARVVVNRWWAEIFGQGLVTTPEDFGTQGERPSHPELLDWLAVEFMENGWSMKHMHRLMVHSATYQQDSRLTEAAATRDPDNRLLARGPRWRMPAEMIRDNALAISGLLSTDMGGPPIYPPQPEGIWRHVGRNAPQYETDTDADRYRRGIYVVWRRSAPYPSFVNFDAPDRAACVVQRSRTNTPLQALTLLNDPAYVEMAYGLAHRLMAFEGTDDGRIAFAFRLCVARSPSTHETEHLLSVLQREQAFLEADASVAAGLIPAERRLEGVPLSIQGAWFTISNILLNLDETITRG